VVAGGYKKGEVRVETLTTSLLHLAAGSKTLTVMEEVKGVRQREA
jgi:hypothetical protein